MRAETPVESNERLHWAMGLSAAGLVDAPNIGPAHPSAAEALQRLMNRARAAGIELTVASGYRSYARQLAIFNAKARGERPVLSAEGQLLTRADMADLAWVHAILRFSALPGTSRHHWGTDFDIWDPATVDADYELQLEPWEYRADGPFAALDDWLSARIAEDDAEGFYRPYVEDTGGVAVEPWHISHRPSARLFAACVSREPLLKVWSGSIPEGEGEGEVEPLELADVVSANFGHLIDRYGPAV